MGTITDLKPQLKDKNRVNVYVDNKFVCGMELETVLKSHLKIGSVVENNELVEIQFDSEKITAFNKCAKLLSTRLKTTSEMKKYLLSKGYEQPVVDYCIDKLKEYKFLNDVNYVEAFVKHNSDKKGPNLLKNQLLEKGVDKQTIEEFFDNFDTQKDEILNLYNKFMKNKENTFENRQKCLKRLIGRGFSYDEIKSAISFEED